MNKEELSVFINRELINFKFVPSDAPQWAFVKGATIVGDKLLQEISDLKEENKCFSDYIESIVPQHDRFVKENEELRLCLSETINFLSTISYYRENDKFSYMDVDEYKSLLHKIKNLINYLKSKRLMSNSEQNPERGVATGDDSSTKVGNKKDEKKDNSEQDELWNEAISIVFSHAGKDHSDLMNALSKYNISLKQ